MRNVVVLIFILIGSWVVISGISFLALGLILTAVKNPIIIEKPSPLLSEEKESNTAIDDAGSYKTLRIKILEEELLNKAIGFCPREESLDCSYPDISENYCLTDKTNCRYEKFQVEENYIVLLEYFSATKVFLYLSDRENIRLNIKSLENGGEDNYIETLSDFFYEQLDNAKKELTR